MFVTVIGYKSMCKSNLYSSRRESKCISALKYANIRSKTGQKQPAEKRRGQRTGPL